MHSVSSAKMHKGLQFAVVAVTIVTLTFASMFVATSFSSEAATKNIVCSVSVNKTTVTKGEYVTFNWEARSTVASKPITFARLSTRDSDGTWHELARKSNPSTNGTFSVKIEDSGRYTFMARNADNDRCFSYVDINVTSGTSGDGSKLISSECPLYGGTVVDFGNDRLVADRGLLETSADVALPAGEYNVTYYSYDGYIGRENANLSQQDEEQWNLLVQNGGSTFQTFGPTQDLQDGVEFAETTGTFATNVTLAQPVTRLVAQHKLFPGSNEPHSVVPGCVKFEKIEEQKLVCDLQIDAHESNYKGEQRELTWTTEGATYVSLDGVAVAHNGVTHDWPWEHKTYTLIAKNNEGDVVECEQKVRVDNPSTPTPPQNTELTCDLSVDSNYSNYKGESRVFEWTTTGATSVTFNGASVNTNGNAYDWPWEDKTYTLVAKNDNGNQVECVEHVTLPENNNNSW